MLNKSIALTLARETSPAAGSCRHRILQQLLENKEGLTIDQLTKHLKISRTAVQNYFLALEKEGLIRKHQRSRTLGRPTTNYVLTRLGVDCFPKRYALHAELLLQELKNEKGPDQLIAYMQKLGNNLANQYQSRFEGQSGEEKFKTLFDLMQELGFHPLLRSDSASQTVDMIAHNCIYHDIAQHFPEICALDQTMVAVLLNKNVELSRCIAKGDGACCFRMALE